MLPYSSQQAPVADARIRKKNLQDVKNCDFENTKYNKGNVHNCCTSQLLLLLFELLKLDRMAPCMLGKYYTIELFL